MHAHFINMFKKPAIKIGAILFAATLISIIFFAVASDRQKPPGPCDDIKWENSDDQFKCTFPDPPIGRWKAVYTKAFAKAYNLPPENISRDLSPGVDYMEMDVQPYGAGGVACLVNMLIKKPNDVAVYNLAHEAYPWEKALHERRTLAHFIDLDAHKDKLKRITTFGLAPRHMKFDPHKSYGIGSSFAFHAEDILEGYDYITADAHCYNILSDKTRYPNNWSFDIAKASVWGRYHYGLIGNTRWKRPATKREYFDSLLLINIPHELIESVFEGMPIGGRQ
jgi:hypothetical protein